jgi:hypothetical protein
LLACCACPTLNLGMIPCSSAFVATSLVKTFLTYLALFGFTAVSVVSVVRAVRTEMRREPVFGAAALGAWLIAPPREDESPATLRRASHQLEQEFHEKFNRRAEYQALDKAQRRIFEANWKRLVVALVRREADEFAAMPEHRHKEFLKQRLERLSTWYVYDDGVKVPMAAAFSRLKNSSGSALRLDPSEIDRIAKLAEALQKAALDRIKNAVFPGGGQDRGEVDGRDQGDGRRE